MSKSQRDKGARGEREICDILSGRYGVPVKRNLGQARDSGDDITFGEITWEVKRRKSFATIYQWMQQAAMAAVEKNTIPVVVHRADNAEWLVTLHILDFLHLADEYIMKHIHHLPRTNGGHSAADDR